MNIVSAAEILEYYDLAVLKAALIGEQRAGVPS